jgi:hypothetical protein
MAAIATHVFGAADAKISPLNSDTDTATVYGLAIDVPGIKSIEISGSSETKEFRGDNVPLVTSSVLTTVEVTLTFAKWDPNIYALLTGSDLTEDGDDYEVALTSASRANYFRLRAVSVNAEGNGSNVYIELPKMIATELPDMVGLSEEDFKTVEVKCQALPRSSDGKWLVWGYAADAVTL